jgi:hypothetical protein
MRKLQIAAIAVFMGSAVMLAPALSAQIAVGISVRIGPPPLRVVAVQPMCPGPGYIWTPGYWAYGGGGYYWVPGAWVMAPRPGLLWTPGYWGYAGGAYGWHPGYWGPRVGFYGGINYGFGYFGTGFVGGHWAGGRFYYNTAVWRVNRAVIRTTYEDRRVLREDREDRISYNGGERGVRARATAEEMRYARERHEGATPMQYRGEARARMAARRGGGYRSFGAPARGRGRQAQAGRRGRGGRGNGAEARQEQGRRGKGRGNAKHGRGKDGRRGPGRSV